MTTDATLALKVIADTAGATKGMDDVAGGASKLGPAVKLGLAAVAAGAVAVGKALYDVGATFSDMKDTIRVGTGATGKNLDSLVNSAKNVGKTTPAEFGKIGTAVADLNTRLGLTGDDLETVAKQVLESGRILGEETNIKTATGAFKSFGISNKDVSTSLDDLFRVSQATGVGMNDLAAQAGKNGPAMKNLGFTFGDTISLIGSLDKAGLNSTQMMGAMSKGLVTLAKSGEDPQQAFRDTTTEISKLVAEGKNAEAIKLASGIFGTKAASQFVGAVQSGTLALDDLTGAVGATNDTILGVAGETQHFAEKWEIVKNNVMLAVEPLASGVFDALGATFEWLTPYIQQAAEWLNTVGAVLAGEIQTAIGDVAAQADTFGTSLAGAGEIANQVATWFMENLWPAISGLVDAIGSAWTSAQTILTEMVAGFQERLGPMLPQIQDIFGKIGEVVTGVVGLITALITKGTEVWNQIWEDWGGPFMNFVSDVWEAIIGIIGPILDIITGVIGVFTSALSGDWEGVWKNIQQILKGAWDLIKGIFTGAFDIIKSLVTNAWTGLKNTFSGGIEAVVNFVTGLPDKILGALGDFGSMLWNAGKGIIDGFLNGLKAAWDAVANWIGGIGDWIAEHKGPIEYDRKLLVPAGKAIMQSLQTGLKSELGNLESVLDTVTTTIAGTSADIEPTITLDTRTGTTAAGTGNVYITVQGAVDPMGTARQIRDMLNEEARWSGRVEINGAVI